MTAVPIATVFGGPLSGALLGLHGYLGVEAGVGSSSSRAPSPCCSGSSPSSSSRTGRRTSNGSHLRSVMHSISALPLRRKRPAPMAILELARRSTNPCVIQLGLVYFCLVVGLYRIGFWMPQVLQTFGLYNLSIGFLTAIPYLIAAIGMVIAGTPLRCQGRAHLACGAAALCVGRGLRLVGKCRAPSAPHACALACRPRTLCRHRHFWSLPTSILTCTGAAAGLALINSIGNCGGFVGPVIVGHLKVATGDFTAALLFLAGALALAGDWRSISGRWRTAGGGREALRRQYYLSRQ